MATSFDDIYGLNEAIMTDSRINSLPENLYYYVLYKYLQYSIGEFRTICWKNLDLLTAFDQEIYTFTGDGTTYSFLLNPAPPTSSNFYVSVNNVETTNFTFNSGTNYLTLGTTPILNASIYVGAYVIGEFTQDLNVEEQTILSIGMTVPFLKSNVINTKQLKQMISAAPINIASQANHNKVLFEGHKQIEQEFLDRMNRYSWRNDPNDLADAIGEFSV